MSDQKLQLRVILSAVERVTAPLRRVNQVNTATTAKVKALRDQLGQLNRSAAQIDGYRKTAEQAAKTGQALKLAQGRVDALAKEMQASTAPARELQQAFAEAKREAGRLSDQHTELLAKQQRQRTALAASGIETRKLATHQRELRAAIGTASQALASEEAHLKQINDRMRQSIALRTRFAKSMQFRNEAAGAGASMLGAGTAMGLPVLKMVKDFATFEDAMLGIARQVEGARDANGKLTRTYYEMADAIKAMSEVPGAQSAVEIAAIVEAGARMGVQGKDNLLAFAKTAGMAATAFDAAAGQIGDDFGKIATNYKIPISRIAELGDTINWLDDNAQSKGADIIEVLQRLGSVADKLDYRKAAALGSTFLSLGASAEVAATASNAIVTKLAAAASQPKTFQAGLAALRLDAKAIQKGMVTDATGTIMKLMDALRLLPKETQATVTTQLFGMEYGDDASKLANNLGEYRRQLALVESAAAKGSMARESDAKSQNLSAQWQTLQNKVFNSSSGLGAALKPALVDLMKSAGDILGRVTAWTKANPELAATLVKIAAVLAVIVTAMGALTLALAAVLGPLAMVKFGMGMLGLQFGGGLRAIGLLSGGLMKLISVARIVFAFLLANPLVAIAVAIAAAAIYIWANWDQLGPKFAALWASIKAYAGAAWDWISGKAGAVAQALTSLFLNWTLPGLIIKHWDSIKSFMSNLPAHFMAIGSQIIDGLINGITAKWGALKAQFASLGDALPGWLKTKLDIHSPSRVFAQIGRYTMQGLEVGIDKEQRGPLDSMRAISRRLTVPFAGMASASLVAASPVQIDNRPPLAARPAVSQAAPVTFGDIHIHPAPGMNEQQLARLVAQEITRHQRQAAAAGRSRLSDSE